MVWWPKLGRNLYHPQEEPVSLLTYKEPRSKSKANLKPVNTLIRVKFRQAKAETMNGVLKSYIKYAAHAWNAGAFWLRALFLRVCHSFQLNRGKFTLRTFSSLIKNYTASLRNRFNFQWYVWRHNHLGVCSHPVFHSVENTRENKHNPIQDSFMAYEQIEQKGQILCLFAFSIRYGGTKTSRQLAFSLHQHKSGLPSQSVGLCWCDSDVALKKIRVEDCRLLW